MTLRTLIVLLAALALAAATARLGFWQLDRAAQKLGVDIGDKLTFVAPEVAVTPAGMFPRMKRFTVVGLFNVGAGELDAGLALVKMVMVFADANVCENWILAPSGKLYAILVPLDEKKPHFCGRLRPRWA